MNLLEATLTTLSDKRWLDTLNTLTPLVNQMLLNWLAASYIYIRASEEEREAAGLRKPQGIGYGIGLAFAIFSMQGTPSRGSFWQLLLTSSQEVSSLVRIDSYESRTCL